MFKRLVTKNGENIWYKDSQPLLGRKEVARLAFATWDRRREFCPTKNTTEEDQ